MNIFGDRNNLTTQFFRQPEADTSNVTGVGNYMVLPLACFGAFFGSLFVDFVDPSDGSWVTGQCGATVKHIGLDQCV